MALWDLANADCIIVMGSNMAENHPVGFRFVVEAQRRGATVIHVDPRFTRTSALANIHAPIRSGTDIAFLGGIIHYILENDLWFRDFALAYTNIANIVEDSYRDAGTDGGVFSGFDADNGSYKHDTWQYQGEVMPSRSGRAPRADSGEASRVATSRRCRSIRRRPIRRCSTRTASTRSCAATTRATRRRWWSA